MSILEKIHCHADLQGLSRQEQGQLCEEIRDFLIQSISKTGGHLASNLGVVELTVALETVYDTDIDRLVFDVGHQSYVHKLLTGRQADFSALRQYGGIAGFPKPSESRTDAFVAGHASASVSVALGMARARTLCKQDYHVAVVLGDGAATGGMVYEALNDVAYGGENMVIVLNDNQMSISPNVGGIARHLKKLRTKARYLDFKKQYQSAMSRNVVSRGIYRATHWTKDRIKRLLLPSTIFENMGLTYLGPVDGNDLSGLITLLSRAKEMNGPVLVHVITQKGRGYLPAEQDPAKFHGIGAFDPVTGMENRSAQVSFSENFGRELVRLGAEEPRLCAITAAMPNGTGLAPFMRAYPTRVFDVGIAEEHAVSMAGGLAKQGMIPVVALYSTFLQRSFDQILQDVAMLGLHVVFAVDRAGLVGADGETHHGIFDVGYLRMAPGMTILCPACLEEQSQMLSWAVKTCRGPVAIRYPRGGNRRLTVNGWQERDQIEKNGLLSLEKSGTDVMFVSYGVFTENVLKASEILEESGLSAGVIRLLTVAPLPIEQVIAALGTCTNVMIAEDSAAGGGIREHLAFQLHRRRPDLRIDGIDLGEKYVPHGSNDELYAHCALDADSIARKTKEVFGYEN